MTPAPDDVSETGRAAVNGAAEIGLAAFEQSPVSMVVYDAEGRLLALNPAFERLWGVRLADAPPDYCVLRDPQLEQQGVLPLIERAFAGESVTLPPVRYDISAASPSGRGRTLWTQAHLYALRDESGRVERVVLTHEDVTARLEAERELRASEARFRAAVLATSEMVWTNDPEGRMLGEQRDWAEFTGQSRAEYEGYGWAAAVHPDDAAPTIEAWSSAVAERRPFVFEHRVRRRDGVYRVFAIRAVPVLGEDDGVREWVGVHRDVTEERERSAALEHQNRLLQDQALELEMRTDELLRTTDELRDVIIRSPNMQEIQAALAKTQFVKLAQSGYELVAEGAVAFQEIDKAVGR
jgi:PAS domain S-box-containing protein